MTAPKWVQDNAAVKRAHNSWRGMKERCSNANHVGARWYSELDIDFDPRWDSFEAFLLDMGPCAEGLELDRVDSNFGYCKANCRWVSRTDNVRNSSKTVLTADTVRMIKGILCALKPGVQLKEAYPIIGEAFGVSASAIRHIKLGHTWKDVA